jgi:hypothetical protein
MPLLTGSRHARKPFTLAHAPVPFQASASLGVRARLAARLQASMQRAMRILSTALLLSVAVAATALAQGQSAPFTLSDSGRGYATLSDALNAIGDGQGTIIVAPGT